MHAGKKRFQYLTVASAVIAALVAAAPVRTASARDSLAPNCSDGTYKIGTAEAHYLVCLPSVWNGDLVVYAHGYVNPYEPLAVQDNTIDGVPISQIVTGLGFAYAATSYRQNGLVIPEAVEDVRELVDQFPLLAGAPPPNHVYLVGASEGGLVTALAMEKYREFSGGLATCGPVGSFRQQINYFGDFLVIFNYFFPDVLKGLANGETSTPEHIPDALLGQNWDDIQAAVLSAITSNPSATKQLLRVTGAAVDPTDAV
jgi:pimeloyl-ACP methyl ester carboxylesterase